MPEMGTMGVHAALRNEDDSILAFCDCYLVCGGEPAAGGLERGFDGQFRLFGRGEFKGGPESAS